MPDGFELRPSIRRLVLGPALIRLAAKVFGSLAAGLRRLLRGPVTPRATAPVPV